CFADESHMLDSFEQDHRLELAGAVRVETGDPGDTHRVRWRQRVDGRTIEWHLYYHVRVCPTNRQLFQYYREYDSFWPMLIPGGQAAWDSCFYKKVLISVKERKWRSQPKHQIRHPASFTKL